jgi:hypothetical protein
MTDIIGVLTVKNDPYPVDLAMKSVIPYLDGVLVIDSSTDEITTEKIKQVLKEAECETKYEWRDMQYWEAWMYGFNKVKDDCEYIFRMESDVIYTKKGMERILSVRNKHCTVWPLGWWAIEEGWRYTSKAQKHHPHPILYHTGTRFFLPGYVTVPRDTNRQVYAPIGGMNVRMGPPLSLFIAEHLHYWRRADVLNSPRFILDDVEPPYSDHMDLYEYVKKLYEQGKGFQFGGETIVERAVCLYRNRIKFRTEHKLFTNDWPKSRWPEVVIDALESDDDPRKWTDTNLDNPYLSSEELKAVRKAKCEVHGT